MDSREIHQLKIQSISDSGGYATVGITKNMTDNAESSYSLASNGIDYNYNDLFKDNTWEKKELKWGKLDIITLILN